MAVWKTRFSEPQFVLNIEQYIRYL